MPLVAHNNLPSFERLRKEGQTILNPEYARRQDIRELHIGLLNMMPDKAIRATERQFFRLVGESNAIAQFYMHPFTLPELARSPETQTYIANYYESFDTICKTGLDALIITGANVTHPALSMEPFWEPLNRVITWAYENVTSTLCSCLATHAVLESRYQQRRILQKYKRWGVFLHQVCDRSHPLVNDVNSQFYVPHSRWNDISQAQFEAAGAKVLACSDEVGVHLAVSPDGFRIVFFQGHPEYDTISLLKEYKRELRHFIQDQIKQHPPFPNHYLLKRDQAILDEYRGYLLAAKEAKLPLPKFPEALIVPRLQNTWHDTAEAIVGNWMGLIYQITNQNRNLSFMPGVDPQNPLNLKLN
ncbi:homoserine O-succinyltransferase [Achromatium sp. WMS3]|nr:homoserine O-succinyltransferase [Achromatium sp. WMS3]